MSQSFQFYKLKVFSEKTTQGFSRENVYESLKSLLKGSDRYSSEMIEEYLELVPLSFMHISASEIEELIPELDKKLKYVFDPQLTTLFMVDEAIWSGVQVITEKAIREILREKSKSKTTNRLQDIYEISNDYILLSKLFEGKLLFVNIF